MTATGSFNPPDASVEATPLEDRGAWANAWCATWEEGNPGAREKDAKQELKNKLSLSGKSQRGPSESPSLRSADQPVP